MKVEIYLGRSLASEHHVVETLNDLSAFRLAEARLLARHGRLAVVDYLQHVVRHADLDDVAAFFDDVVSGDVPPNEWGFRDVISIASIDTRALLTTPRDEVLAKLEAIDGERWWRATPTRSLWDSSGLAGAPGVLLRRIPYWWREPDGTTSLDLEGVETERIRDIAIAYRRWIASRVAWDVRDRGSSAIDEVCRRLSLDATALTNDAAIALRAWASAGAEFAGAGVPGFTGDEELYIG